MAEKMDSDDVDRVVQNLMNQHEAVSARARVTRAGAIAVVLDEHEPTEQAFLLDADGESVLRSELGGQAFIRGLLDAPEQVSTDA